MLILLDLQDMSLFMFNEIKINKIHACHLEILDFRIVFFSSVGASEATDELYALAAGLDRRVYSYTVCIVNGVKFVTIN